MTANAGPCGPSQRTDMIDSTLQRNVYLQKSTPRHFSRLPPTPRARLVCALKIFGPRVGRLVCAMFVESWVERERRGQDGNCTEMTRTIDLDIDIGADVVD
jgi:hypothetical protein